MNLHQLSIEDVAPRTRGRALGSTYADQVRAATAGYLAHFEALGVPAARVRDIAATSREALHAWAPALALEADAVAEAAGVEPVQLAAVAARTEVLAASQARGECTTAVRVPADGAPETIQTWDWHDALVPDGLLLASASASGRRFKLFTEFGTAAKIGLNDAGLGLHFNILHHASDHAGGGVPVHAVARRVIEDATTISEALEIARSATLSASTVLTVVTLHEGVAQAASIEMSPAGVAVVAPEEDGWLVHSNHFLDGGLAIGERADPASLSFERRQHTLDVRDAMAGLSVAGRATVFAGGADPAAVVCMRPDPELPLHEQWGTLLTISLDLAGFALDYSPGTPDLAGNGLDRF